VRISDLEKHISSLNREIKMKDEDIQAKEQLIEDADKQKPQQDETLKSQSTMLLSFQRTLLAKEQMIRELEGKLEQLEIQVPKYDVGGHISELESTLNQHIREITRLQQVVQEREAAIHRLEETNRVLQTTGSQPSSNESDNLRTRNQIIVLTRELEKKNQTIKELERTINEETSPFLIQVETELNKYRQELSTKQDKIQQLELLNNEVNLKSQQFLQKR
jgi:chromosome segregation ATPase